ncbi:MAG: hypothetical protein ACREQC_18795 [Candidatus Binataceae bacterium]
MLRHWTAILILLVISGWALLYLPDTPSYAVFRLKQSVDARNGDAAGNYVDFQKVVRAAGAEIIQGDNPSGDTGGNLLGQLLGKGMVDLFSAPMAALLQQWAVQQVNYGAQEVQMPAAGVAAAILLLHRDGDTAYTRWTDHKGQVWEVRMAREDGRWKIVEVKNVRALLEKLRRHEQKEFNTPSS